MEKESEKVASIYDETNEYSGNAEEMSVTDWENIAATNIILPNLEPMELHLWSGLYKIK